MTENHVMTENHPAIAFLEKALGADPILDDTELRAQAIRAWPPGGMTSADDFVEYGNRVMPIVRQRRRLRADAERPAAFRLALAHIENTFGPQAAASSSVRFVIEAYVESLRSEDTTAIYGGEFFAEIKRRAKIELDRIRPATPQLVEEISEDAAMLMHAVGVVDAAPHLSPLGLRDSLTDAPGTPLEKIPFTCEAGHHFLYPAGQNDHKGDFVRYDRVACIQAVDVAFGGVYQPLGGICTRDARPDPKKPEDPLARLSNAELATAAKALREHAGAEPYMPMIGALVERLEKANALVAPTPNSPLALAITKTADLPGTGARHLALGEATGFSDVDGFERYAPITTHPAFRIEGVRADSGDPRLDDVAGVKVYGEGYAAAPGDYIVLWYTADGKYPTLAARGENAAQAVTNLLRMKLEKELELTKTGRASYDAGGAKEPPGMAFRDGDGMRPRPHTLEVEGR